MSLLVSLTALLLSAPEPLYYLDLSELRQMDRSAQAEAHRAWDTVHLVASLQGIVNRDAPRLFIRFMPDPDDFWWDYLRGEGQWLEDREVVTLGSWQEAVRTFAPYLRGAVVYDERVWATSNLASTIAGIEDRLCLRYDAAPDSVYAQALALDVPALGDALRLMTEDGGPLFTGEGTIPGTELPSTGSAKCDAYLWAKARYLDKGLCSPEYMAYYIDAYWLSCAPASELSNATLTNHDFFIAERAFFFDLHVWEEESPVDDPGQKPGTDLRTLETIVRAQYGRAQGGITYIGGFIPWAFKYTSDGQGGGKHGGVDTEWKYAQIISSYNGIMDADALGLSGMANASFYRHYPLRERYPQNPRPGLEDLRARGLLDENGAPADKVFICFYMGDYDSAAWLNKHVPRWWKDPAHGETLCTWAFNPNLDRRAPHALDYVRTHQSANDWFMFGDSGAGYLNPGMLLEENRGNGLPGGLDVWSAFCKDYAQRYDLDIVGFIIDGHSPGMGDAGMDAYLQFAPAGIVGQKIPPQGLYKDTMPYLRMRMDLSGNPEKAAALITLIAGVNRPKFHFIRTILQSPSWHKATMERARALDPGIEFVDPYTFFLLLGQYERNKRARAAENLRKAVSFTAPDQADGMGPVSAADGPYSIAETAGRPVLFQPKAEQTRYLYFETDDTFAGALAEDTDALVVVNVTVYDAAPGEIGIHYDAHEGGSYRDGPKRKLRGAHDWAELQFPLRGARFAHGQNSAADFRLVNFGNDLHVAELRVSR